MEISEEAMAAAIERAVAAAMAERDAQDAARLAALETARTNEVIANGFEGMVSAIAFAAEAEAQKAAEIDGMLAGLSAGLDAAVLLELTAYALRDIKVAVFDADGRYCGQQSGRAELIDLSADDPFTRLLWRPEWDVEPIYEEVRYGGVGPEGPAMRTRQAMRLPIPDLADIPGALDEIGRPFAEYPTTDLT